jgi:hypothetical protein
MEQHLPMRHRSPKGHDSPMGHRHGTDAVSLVFGLLFVAVAGWWLFGRYVVSVDVPNLGWLVAGALILMGLLGVVASLRGDKTSADAAVTQDEPDTPDADAAVTHDEPDTPKADEEPADTSNHTDMTR